MKRVLLTTILVLLFYAFWQSLAHYLPPWLNLFFPPSMILVFSLQFYRPLETILVCLFCGMITDILGGLTIGSNMLLMLFLTFTLSSISIFSGRLDRQRQVFYVIMISFIYRLLMLFFYLIFLGTKANISLLQLILGPLVDGLVSIVFFKLLMTMLSLAKAMDQSEFFNNRLGLR